MDEDSYEVELRGGGWSGAIGTVRGLYNLTHEFTHGVVWEKLFIEELLLGHAAALLIAQGMQLRELFPDSSYLITRPSNIVFSNGPYILLKGQLAKPNDPPPRLKEVVLAHVTQVPKDTKMESLMGLLLQQVL